MMVKIVAFDSQADPKKGVTLFIKDSDGSYTTNHHKLRIQTLYSKGGRAITLSTNVINECELSTRKGFFQTERNWITGQLYSNSI